jgi:hypothetical protein
MVGLCHLDYRNEQNWSILPQFHLKASAAVHLADVEHLCHRHGNRGIDIVDLLFGKR